MKAIVCEKFAPLDELTYQEMPEPKVGSYDVKIKVSACGVNYPDGLMVQGLYQMKPEFPFVPGSEAVGIIEELGEKVPYLKVGDRVIAMGMGGFFAEKAVANMMMCMPVRIDISDEEAAGLVTAHATAHHALKQRANLQESETLLVTGAAGGTGLAAVQIGKAMGAKVIAVCSTQEKLDLAMANGAELGINYTEVDLKDEIKRITEGKGVDVVYDVVGGDAFNACSRAMAWNGRLLVIGFASGTIPQFPVNLALVKGYAVLGVFWGSFTQHQPKDFQMNMQELMQWYAEGKVKVHVDEVFPLQDAVSAMQKVMGRKVKGKVILKP